MCKSCVDKFKLELSPEYLKDLPPLFQRVAWQIYTGELKPGQISEEMVRAIAAEMWQGIISELETTGTVDPGIVAQFQENIYVFSGFKNYQMIKEASLLLIDEATGQRKPFTKFLQDITSINETYNRHYLLAEYNHAVASAQMASNWAKYQETIDVAPYLRYNTAEDDRVRPAHAALNGVVKRIDDPFWNTYYPPNGWNCRCDVIQTMDGPETGEDFAGPQLPDLFKTNVGKSGTVFPDTHPYYNDVPKERKKQITETAKSLIA